MKRYKRYSAVMAGSQSPQDLRLLPLVSLSDIITRLELVHMVYLPVPNRKDKGAENSRVHNSLLSGKVFRSCPNFLLTSFWLEFRHMTIPTTGRENLVSLKTKKMSSEGWECTPTMLGIQEFTLWELFHLFFPQGSASVQLERSLCTLGLWPSDMIIYKERQWLPSEIESVNVNVQWNSHLIWLSSHLPPQESQEVSHLLWLSTFPNSHL